jgi:hypothetical protein
MNRRSIQTVFCLFVVVLGGCMGGGFGDQTSTAECLPPEHSDGGDKRCLTTERNPDLQYWNGDTAPHVLSVTIVRNNSSTVYSNTVRIPPGSEDDPAVGKMTDVVERPGQYTIEATVDNTTTVRYRDTLDRRWRGVPTRWRIFIFSPDEVTIEEQPLGG